MWLKKCGGKQTGNKKTAREKKHKNERKRKIQAHGVGALCRAVRFLLVRDCTDSVCEAAAHDKRGACSDHKQQPSGQADNNQVCSDLLGIQSNMQAKFVAQTQTGSSRSRQRGLLVSIFMSL